MLASLLQCPACGDVLALPTTLTCGHTVCTKHVRMSAADSAAALFGPAPSPSSIHPMHSAHPPLPSCPILTCTTPATLRRRDISSTESDNPHPNDSALPPVVYIPPPNDPRSVRPTPPPPLAHVKVPNPKIDITLQRVLEVVRGFIDLDAVALLPNEATHISPSSMPRSPARRTKSRSSSRSTTKLQRGVHELRLTPSSRSTSPQTRSSTIVHDVSSPPVTSIPGAFDSDGKGQQQLGPPSPSTSEPPTKRQRRSSILDDVVQPVPLREPVIAPFVQQGESASPKAASELEQLAPDKLDALTTALLPEMTCDVCFQLFYDPVTTPCQHVSSICFVSVQEPTG